jgi:hypothetical protein
MSKSKNVESIDLESEGEGEGETESVGEGGSDSGVGVRVKVLSFDIFLSDIFTVGIFISTRGIFAYIYLPIFLLSTFLLSTLFR